jgi:hypothetical protein
MQNQSEEEASTWQVVSEIQESWCHANAGIELTLKILEKDGKYRLLFRQPANCTEDEFIELSGRPIRWLKELEELPHNQYKAIVGNQGYGETDIDAIIKFLGVEFYGRFERSNIS